MKRKFIVNEFYHIFNRGVDKRKIFLDKSDHLRFIHDFYEFNDRNPALQFSRLSEKNHVGSRTSNITSNIKPREPIAKLHVFALMPNHYHSLVEQLEEKGITLFMRKLHTGYTNAFNLKRERSGHLFQGSFKAVRVIGNIQLAYLVCYIHSNPLNIWKPNWKEKKLTNFEIKNALRFLEGYRWSSHLDYLGIRNFPSLINKKFLLEFFGGSRTIREKN